MGFAKQYADWVLDTANERKTGRWVKLAAKRFLNDLARTDVYFDEVEATKMPEFCGAHLCQWEGEWEGMPFKFELWQHFFYEQVFGWFWTSTKTRRFDEAYLQVSKKNGKALYIYTMIPTPAGWRTMLSLQPGDYVFGDDGKPTKVTAISEIMQKESYEITFQGGAKITASGDHLWEIECNNWRTQKNRVSKRTPEVVTTDLIYERYTTRKIIGANIFHVKTCQPVQYPYQNLIINPYLLGVWLGDGSSSGSNITIGNQDTELVDHLLKTGYTVRKCRHHKSAPNYKIGHYAQFVKQLKQYNLQRNKHIPIEFLESSVDQRFELLKGLMDTDGTITKKGQCTYTGCNKRLVEDVFKLVLSLGIKATWTEKNARCQTGKVSRAYNVNFFEDRPVFKLSRKLFRQKKKLNHRSRYRTIVGIVPVGIKSVKCISVDNKSKLYLAGESFIPTHNSSMCAGASNFHVFGDERVKTPKVFAAANNVEQARICVNMAGKMVQASAKHIDDSPFADMLSDDKIGLMNYKENITDVINYENNGFIKALSKESGDKDSKTAGGKHGLNASMGVVDEFGMSPDHGASKTIRSSMASRRERLMLYITTAGYMLEGPCYSELRAIGIQVLEGSIIKDNYLPLIYEIDPPVLEDGKTGEITVDWLLENEEVWQQSNPNIDISVMRDFLRGELQDAKIKGGLTMRDVLTLNFNIWMDSPEVFIPAEIWNNNTHGCDIEDLDGELCYAGIEVGTTGQCTSVALLFPGDIIRVKMLFIAAGDTVKITEAFLNNKDFILIDEGNVVDQDLAIEWIQDEFSKYDLQSFAFAKPQENTSIIQGLIKAGFEGNPISQGVQSIAAPTDEWEKLIRSGDVEHYGNPILAWMNSNCLAVRKEQGTRIQKNGKVLGIYACINAVAQWKSMEAESPGEIGILVI